MPASYENERITYTLRQATENDREFLWHLHRTTMREYVDATWGWEESFQRRFFDEHFDPGMVQIVVVGDEEVGSITVEPREGSLELYNIRILPDRQGLGLGTTLVRDVLTQASQEELLVNLRVLKANPRAKRFYERMGFEVIGETETHHRMRANPSS